MNADPTRALNDDVLQLLTEVAEQRCDCDVGRKCRPCRALEALAAHDRALLPAASAPAPCGHAALLREAAEHVDRQGFHFAHTRACVRGLSQDPELCSCGVASIAARLRAASEACGQASPAKPIKTGCLRGDEQAEGGP